jgi:outer membrane protein TolC
MKVIRSTIFILAALLNGINLFAQVDSIIRFSLVEAQDYAINNFYVSKNAKLDIEAAKKKVWETTAIGLPQVKASANYALIPGTIPSIDFVSSMTPIFDAFNIPDSLRPTGTESPIASRTSLTYGVTVSQLIFSGEYIVGLQASKIFKAISEQTNTKTEIGLKQSVAETYYSILVLEKNRSILEHTLNNLRENLDQMKKTYASGLTDDTGVDQIDLMVKRTDNSLKTLDRQIEILKKVFKYQIGAVSEIDIELTDNLDQLITLNIINDSTYKFILEDNIDYQMLNNREKSMKLLMRREQTTFLPTIAGFYQYQDKTNKAMFDFTIKHIIGIGAEIPIFTSGSRMVKVSQARIELEKARNMKEQEIERIQMQADQATYDYRSSLEKYFNEKENFDLSEKVYNKTTVKFKEGLVSSLDLSLINTQFLQAQMSYAMAMQELLSAKVKLDLAYNQL